MSAMEAFRRVDLAGRPVAVDDDQPTFWDRVDAGRWEPGTLAALAPLLGRDVTFLDLGAWVGPLSLLAAARGARVIAVEADPKAQDQLRRNLAANPDLASRIQIVKAAVSPEPGQVRLGARRKPGDSMSSILLAEGPTSWTTPAVTPAALSETVGEASRLVIKIDIEGGEYSLLPHLAPLLAQPAGHAPAPHRENPTQNGAPSPPHAEVPAGGRPRSTHDRGACFEAPLTQVGCCRLGHPIERISATAEMRGAPQDEDDSFPSPERAVAVLVSFHPLILSQSGEPEPTRRLREAVAVFDGWDAAPIAADGAGASHVLDASSFDLAGHDTWLFRKTQARSLGPLAASR